MVARIFGDKSNLESCTLLMPPPASLSHDCETARRSRTLSWDHIVLLTIHGSLKTEALLLVTRARKDHDTTQHRNVSLTHRLALHAEYISMCVPFRPFAIAIYSLGQWDERTCHPGLKGSFPVRNASRYSYELRALPERSHAVAIPCKSTLMPR